MRIQSLGQGEPLEEEMAMHSSILAWKIPGTEEAGGVTKSRTQLSTHALCVTAYFQKLWMVRAPTPHTRLRWSIGLAYRHSRRPLRCTGYVLTSPSFCRPHSLSCADHIRAQLFSAPGICFSDVGWLMKAHHLFTAGFLFHSLLSTLRLLPVGSHFYSSPWIMTPLLSLLFWLSCLSSPGTRTKLQLVRAKTDLTPTMPVNEYWCSPYNGEWYLSFKVLSPPSQAHALLCL